MGRGAADTEVHLGGGRRFGVCCCFYDSAAPRKGIVLQGGKYGWGDGKVVGVRSGGDEGDFCLGERQAAGGFVGGGRVCSELTASRLLLL